MFFALIGSGFQTGAGIAARGRKGPATFFLGACGLLLVVLVVMGLALFVGLHRAHAFLMSGAFLRRHQRPRGSSSARRRSVQPVAYPLQTRLGVVGDLAHLGLVDQVDHHLRVDEADRDLPIGFLAHHHVARQQKPDVGLGL